MGLLYGRAGRLTAQNGGSRPGQWPEHGANGESYGDNSATLWGRLVGNGTYDMR